jgi:hypothetical protein
VEGEPNASSTPLRRAQTGHAVSPARGRPPPQSQTPQGRVWSAGYPQYGQLGDGDDHMYNAKDCEWGGMWGWGGDVGVGVGVRG